MPESTETRPMPPGWYWIKLPTGIVIDESIRYDHNWTPIEVEDGESNYVLDKSWTTCGNPDKLTLAGAEWIGPITPEDAAELARLRAIAHFTKGNTLVELTDSARLRAAGDALVAVAKEAACALEGEDNASLRGRLCDAIAGWLDLSPDTNRSDSR